jgi:hypothetical protein
MDDLFSSFFSFLLMQRLKGQGLLEGLISRPVETHTDYLDKKAWFSSNRLGYLTLG